MKKPTEARAAAGPAARTEMPAAIAAAAMPERMLGTGASSDETSVAWVFPGRVASARTGVRAPEADGATPGPERDALPRHVTAPLLLDLAPSTASP
jgi:hypothetical protein